MLGIEGFQGLAATRTLRKMIQDLNKARAADRKDKTGKRMKDVLTGKARKAVDQREGKTILHYVQIIRSKFAGYVIRRHEKSIDWEGNLLTGLDPPCEVKLALTMYPLEAEYYTQLLADLEKIGKVNARDQKVCTLSPIPFAIRPRRRRAFCVGPSASCGLVRVRTPAPTICTEVGTVST